MLVFTGGYTQDIPMASGEVVPGRSGGTENIHMSTHLTTCRTHALRCLPFK